VILRRNGSLRSKPPNALRAKGVAKEEEEEAQIKKGCSCALRTHYRSSKLYGCVTGAWSLRSKGSDVTSSLHDWYRGKETRTQKMKRVSCVLTTKQSQHSKLIKSGG
jgi:hypothetical protein